MKAFAGVVLGLALLGTATPAHAEPTITDSHVTRGDDEAWARYDEAFVELALGRDRAQRLLRALVDDYPEHPAAVLARGLLGREAGVRERKTAREELVLWQTLGGFMLGGSACTIVDCNDSRTLAAVLAVSVVASFAVSYGASEGIEEGEAHLYNSAIVWGVWNALGASDRFASADTGKLLIVGQMLGIPAAYALWHAWQPDEGAIAMANSGGLWSMLLYVWLAVADNSDPKLHDAALAADVGLVVGALASTKWHMSRSRTLIIDTGGAIGLLAGGLAVALQSSPSDRSIGISVAAGTALGLAAAVRLSRNWDAPVHLAPMPIAGPSSTGLGAGLVVRF